MQAGDTLRTQHAGGNGRDRERRGIRRQHRIRPDDCLQGLEKRNLGVQPLDNRLHHEVTMAQRFEGRADESGAELGNLRCVQSAFGLKAFPLQDQGGFGTFGDFGLVVHQQYLAAGLCRDLRDTAAHGTAADDGDGVKLRMHTFNY